MPKQQQAKNKQKTRVRRKSAAKPGKPPAPQINLNINAKPHKQEILAPNPIVHRAIQHTIDKDGMDKDKVDKRGIELGSLMMTAKDRYYMALLHNLFEPSRPYPLPGIKRSGLPGVDLSQAWAGGINTILQDTLLNTNEIRGSTVHYMNMNEESCVIGRYARFSGRVTHSVEFQTNASGEAEYWFIHDPTCLNFPLLILDMTTKTAPNYTSLVVKDFTGWTSNPYPIAQAGFLEQGSNAVEQLESLNLYYEGAAALHVSTLNSNAWLSTSYQVRTGNNVVDSMYTRRDFYAGNTYADNCGWSDVPSKALGALSVYTGENWHAGTLKQTGLVDPDDEKFWASHCLNRCWAMGAPFVRCVVRTQSNGAPAAGSVAFNISLNVWAATAPLSMQAAGGMPLETLPFFSPPWLRAIKTRGSLAENEQANKMYMEAARNVASALPSVVSGETLVERALVRQPKEVMTHAAKVHVPEQPAQSSWSDSFSSLVRSIPTIVQGIQTASALGSVILGFL
jgi:hypothetical protein